MDEDLETMDRAQLIEEVRKLRAGIREHRDSTGHDLCWHHPALWALLPERADPEIAVVILTAAGERAFSAGGDAAHLEEVAGDVSYWTKLGAEAGYTVNRSGFTSLHSAEINSCSKSRHIAPEDSRLV